jgi:uncharacterized protein
MTTTRSAHKPTIGSDGAPDQIASLDWEAIIAELDSHGCAVIGPILTPAQCETLVKLYHNEGIF